MICYWLNGSLCLAHENEEEHKALSTLFKSFRAGLKPNPFQEKITYRNEDDEDAGDDD